MHYEYDEEWEHRLDPNHADSTSNNDYTIAPQKRLKVNNDASIPLHRPDYTAFAAQEYGAPPFAANMHLPSTNMSIGGKRSLEQMNYQAYGGPPILASPTIPPALPTLERSVSPQPDTRATKIPKPRLPREHPRPEPKLTHKRVYGAFPATATSEDNCRAACTPRYYHRWRPSDKRAPVNDTEMEPYVRRLYDAIVDLSEVNLPLSRTRNGNRLILTNDYTEEYIAWRCWKLVKYTANLHRDGCELPTFADRGFNASTNLQIFDTWHRGSETNPASYRDCSFDERIDDMCYALTKDKIIACDVLDAQMDLGYALVLAPVQAIAVKKANAKNNAGRDRLVKKIKDAEPPATVDKPTKEYAITASWPKSSNTKPVTLRKPTEREIFDNLAQLQSLDAAQELGNMDLDLQAADTLSTEAAAHILLSMGDVDSSNTNKFSSGAGLQPHRPHETELNGPPPASAEVDFAQVPSFNLSAHDFAKADAVAETWSQKQFDDFFQTNQWIDFDGSDSANRITES